MIDSVAACLDITASRNHQIIASQSISILHNSDKKTDTATNLAASVATAVTTFCQQHALKHPACTLMLPASSYQLVYLLPVTSTTTQLFYGVPLWL